MTLEEIDQTGYWSNGEYFDYMKETGNWWENGVLDHDGESCERCEQDTARSWLVEAYFDVKDVGTKDYRVVTEFKICTLCMLELHGAAHSDCALP